MVTGLPLSGLKIVAIEQYGAGPFGSLHLSDLGADVIKIEDPIVGGDVGRFTPPYTVPAAANAEGRVGHDSLFFQSLNRNKRSVALDLRTRAGRQVFERLVRVVDAVYSNLRGDVPAKLGITYDQLSSINPRIVCCSLSGFGMTGPRRGQPGYDYLLQGLGGWMSLTGEPDGPPTKTGASLVDFTGGIVAALALLAGVRQVSETGVGTDCDVSLYDTAVSMLNYLAAWHLTAGHEPERTADSAHPSLVPFQNFRTADSWIVIACPKEKFWRRLVEALDSPSWALDPRFDDFAGRGAHRHDLQERLGAELATRTTAEWIAVLQDHGVPCAEVNSVAEALREPHTTARGLLIEVAHPVWSEVRQVATAARVGEPRAAHRRAPDLGEDTRDVLTELCGFTTAEQDTLRAAGAFGPVKG